MCFVWATLISFLFTTQDSMVGKSISEVNFDCFSDDINKDEVERLQQRVTDVESENNCQRLMITKLEDELIIIRKCESRTVSKTVGINTSMITDEWIYFACDQKQDRNLKADKLKVLRHKIKLIENSFDKNKEAVADKPNITHDPAMIEDELKSEIDVLNKLVKLVSTTKMNLEKTIKENAELKSANEAVKAKLLGMTRYSPSVMQIFYCLLITIVI